MYERLERYFLLVFSVLFDARNIISIHGRKGLVAFSLFPPPFQALFAVLVVLSTPCSTKSLLFTRYYKEARTNVSLSCSALVSLRGGSSCDELLVEIGHRSRLASPGLAALNLCPYVRRAFLTCHAPVASAEGL